jgi:hypothetical protein
MKIPTLICEARLGRNKCQNKAAYIIIWNGKSRPVMFSSFNQIDLACEKCYNEIMKNHKKLVAQAIDFNDEKVLLT